MLKGFFKISSRLDTICHQKINIIFTFLLIKKFDFNNSFH